MKKVRKLKLNKETVRRLTDEELKGVAGGNQTQHGHTCTCTCTETCPDVCPGDTCRGDTSPCCISCPGTICP